MKIITKVCSTCRKPKPIEDFNKHSRGLDGFQPRCRECQRVGNVNYRERRRDHKLRYRYGLSLEGYEELLEQQNGGCKICGNLPPTGGRLDVDHSHSCCPGEKSCGKCIRGLLCRRCNTLIGQVKEDVGILQAMIGYLET